MSRSVEAALRRTGCLYALIAVVFLCIGGLAALTAWVAEAGQGDAEIIRSLWKRAAYSALVAAGALTAAIYTLRRSR